MRIQVADQAMTDMNRRWIGSAIPDHQNKEKAYCRNISFHSPSS